MLTKNVAASAYIRSCSAAAMLPIPCAPSGTVTKSMLDASFAEAVRHEFSTARTAHRCRLLPCTEHSWRISSIHVAERTVARKPAILRFRIMASHFLWPERPVGGNKR